MSAPIVLLDCDGVLADFVGAVLDLIAKQTGVRHPRELITTWRIWDHIAVYDVLTETIRAPGFCFGIQGLAGTADGVARLREFADVYIVTSPWRGSPTWVHERTEWLKARFDIGPDRQIHTSAKHLVRGDVFVDDKADTVAKWAAAHPSATALLWDTPHNRTEQAARRVTHWDHVVAEARRWM